MVIRHFIAAAFVFIVLLPDTSNSTPLSEERLIHDLKIIEVWAAIRTWLYLINRIPPILLKESREITIEVGECSGIMR